MTKLFDWNPPCPESVFKPWQEEYCQQHNCDPDEAMVAWGRSPNLIATASDMMLDMSQQIRIAIDLDQQTEQGVPIKVELKTADGKDVDVYRRMHDQVPTQQPIDIDGEGGRVFVTDGGNYVAHFWWTASDGKERNFRQDFEIPVPPECPMCEERVPEIPDDDYICRRCRIGH